jgi:branched-chain amino acid transport system substrate-binding protein
VGKLKRQKRCLEADPVQRAIVQFRCRSRYREPMMKRRSFLKAGAAALAVSPFIEFSMAADAPVLIGFSLAKTGIFAPAAPSQANSYDLWRDQVNATGGLEIAGQGKRPIEFVQYDDQSNPGQAARIYEKLITQDKVDLLLAPWGTPTHIAIAPVLERYKFPLIGNTAASVSLRELKPGNIWFLTASFPDRLGRELALMAKANGVKSAAIITNVLPFGKEVKSFLEPGLKEAGISILVNDEYPPDTSDMTALLTKVKQANPDAVFALSYPGDSVLYARQAKELGIAASFEFVLIGPGEDFYPKAIGSAVDNLLTMGQWTPKRNAAAKEFSDAYIAKFHEMPDYLDSIESYVSCQVLQQSVKVAGLDKNKLRDVISTTQFETIIGPVKFTGIENLLTKTGVLQYQDKEPQLVWPLSEATAPYRPKTSW